MCIQHARTHARRKLHPHASVTYHLAQRRSPHPFTCTHPLAPNRQTQAQHGVAVEARAMALLITAKLPRVASHLAGDLGFPAHELAAPWVATCFAGALGSVEASARAWDCLLFEGPKVLHRIALAVLSRFQGAVLACSRAPGLPRLLERSCASAAAAGAAGRRGGGEGAVVEAGFRRVGGLPGAKLAALRAAAAADVERRAAERRRHMELVLGRPSSA